MPTLHLLCIFFFIKVSYHVSSNACTSMIIIYMHQMQKRYLLACHAGQRLFVFIPSEKVVDDFKTQNLVSHSVHTKYSICNNNHSEWKYTQTKKTGRQVPENFESLKGSKQKNVARIS